MTADHSPGLMISSVSVREWPTALELLFATFPAEEVQPRIDSTLIAVSEGRLDLSGLRWITRNGAPLAVSLTMEQPDSVTLVWPPVMSSDAENPAVMEAALLRELTARLDQSGSRLAQILLDPTETTDCSIYEAHGFSTRADLDFLVRTLDGTLPIPDIADWEVETFDESSNRERFVTLIEATYLGSQDCTVLDGLRNGQEALASHRLSGQFHPELWTLYKIAGTDVAVVLLNEHPEQSAVELVYFGVTPAARGRGYGQNALIQALNSAAARGNLLAFLAVDAKNRFAVDVYANLGFSHLSRRQALFRWPGGLARK